MWDKLADLHISSIQTARSTYPYAYVINSGLSRHCICNTIVQLQHAVHIYTEKVVKRLSNNKTMEPLKVLFISK